MWILYLNTTFIWLLLINLIDSWKTDGNEELELTFAFEIPVF